MKAQREHAELLSLIAWIDGVAAAIELPGDERSLLAVGCLDVALEHQAAIALLHSHELYGSALALLRSEFEAVVRGLWLLHCASAEDLIRFKNGKIKREFGELVDAVESAFGKTSGVLSSLKTGAWSAFNGFTHAGYIQVSRRHAPGKITENYDPAELAQALDTAAILGLLAAAQLVSISSSAERVSLFSERMRAYRAARNAA